MSNKPISFKDFNVVDYTFSHETDPAYDPDGLLSYYAWKRQQVREDSESSKAQTADDVMKRFSAPTGFAP
jgi:hypothetical protein